MPPRYGVRAVLRAREDGAPRASGASAAETSLADGTGEGNAPIDGTSASSDPQVLAGTQQDPNAASLNDDDYPEDIPESAGPVEDVSGQSPPPGEEGMSGQTTAAGAAPRGEGGKNHAAAGGENAGEA